MSALVNSYAVMEGMEKYVVSGAVPGLKNVKYHAPDQGAYTTGDTICLPTPAPTMTEEQLLLWRYYAEHEMGHEDPVNSSPHWREIMEKHKKDHDDTFWHISNLLSDHVQEHNRIGVMAGRDQVLLEGRAVFMKHDFDQVKDDNPMYGLGIADWLYRSKWNPYVDAGKVPRRGPVSDDIAKKAMELVDFTALKNEQDVYEAAKKLRPLLPDESTKSSESKASAAKSKPERIAGTIKTHETSKRPEDMGDGPAKFLDDTKDGVYIARTPSPLPRSPLYHEDSAQYSSDIRSQLRKTNLPAKVRAFLMAQRVAKWGTGYRSGRLDTNRLTDVLRNKDDVFKRREERRMVNSAVSLLVDASGSMHGNPFKHASASAIMLAEALQGVGVSVEIACFTEIHGDDLIHKIIHPFGTRFVKERAIEDLASMSAFLANNADGENILYAYNRLKRQPEPKKILVVISDGAPSATGHRDNEMGIAEFTSKVIKQIEADKSVLIHGFGICGHDCSMYKSRSSVGYGEPLEPALLNLAKGWIGGES